MDALTAIATRKSIRKFIDKEIPEDIIRQILKSATRAPSGGNRQPWRFIVVTDREKIRQFDPYYHQPWVEQAPAVIVACADPHDTWAKYDEEDRCYILDTAAAIQNALLTIHILGLGGVWILSCSKRDIRRILGIPRHWQIISIVPFGYFESDDETVHDHTQYDNRKLTSRRPLAEVAFLNGIENPISE